MLFTAAIILKVKFEHFVAIAQYYLGKKFAWQQPHCFNKMQVLSLPHANFFSHRLQWPEALTQFEYFEKKLIDGLTQKQSA